MKKTLQILFFSALSVAGFAQSKATLTQFEGPRALKKMTSEDPKKSGRAPQSTQSNGNRLDVFHETFESGFNGSTELGAWTFSHNLTGVPSTQGTMWSIGDVNYVNVYGGTVAGSDALDSDSPASYALFDGAAYAEEFPSSLDNNGFYSAFLNAPVMDLSELETVIVSFQQVFRYCCFPGSPVSVDVSIDGGTTWTSFNALGDAVEGANVQSVNPLNTSVDISCVAAGQSAVHIRFAYNSAEEAGYSHYFWAIDEVRVHDNPYANDVFIKDIANGNVLTDWEYRVTPVEQIRTLADGGIVVGALVGNKGGESQTGLTIDFTLTSEDGETVYTYTTPAFDLYAALNDTVCPHLEQSWMFWNTEIVPTVYGKYTFSATINTEVAEEAETIADNTVEESLVFSTTAQYGHDGDATADFQWQIGSGFVTGNAGPREPSGFGSHFGFPNAGSSAHGITVRFGSNTENAVEFRAALIRNNSSTETLDASEMVASGNYETGPYMANHASEPLYFAFNSTFPQGGVYPAQSYPVEQLVTNNNNYVAAIWRQNSGVGQLSVRAQETLDADLSSVAWQQGGDLAFHWFHFQEYNYAVRLILSNEFNIPISTEEIEAPTASFSVYPNPAVNDARVAFDLTESKFIAYEVRDLQGRLMDTDNIGRFGAGQNSFSLNVSEYPAGNYIVGLVIDGERMITQQISVIK